MCVCVCVDNFTPQLENVCQLYLKKRNTPHTHTGIFLTSLSLSCSLSTREWRASELANEQTKRGSDIWIAFFFLAIYLCYTSSATSTPTLKGASHSLPEWLPVWVCVCAICNYSTLTLTEKLPVCVCVHVWVDKLISFSFITTLLLLSSALRHQHMRNAQLSANDVTRIEHTHTHTHILTTYVQGTVEGRGEIQTLISNLKHLKYVVFLVYSKF